MISEGLMQNLQVNMYLFHMHNMFHSSTYMIIVRRKKNLSFMLQSSISLAMQNSCIISFKLRPYIIS